MLSHIKQKGFSLLQAMLILVIGSVILSMGYLVYASYKRDADALALLANVDALAQAASSYYGAQCYGSINSSGVVVPGALHPQTTGASNVIPLNIQNDLINTGYLTTSIRPSILVDSTAPGSGYVVQFVRNNATRTVSGVATGTIVNWTINVGVRFKVQANVAPYKAMMQAQCTSDGYPSMGFTGVWPCADVAANLAYCNSSYGSMLPQDLILRAQLGCSVSNNPADYGTYLVFDRTSPSASSKDASELWVTNATVSQFTQQYRNNTRVPQTSGQYFLCN